MSLIFDITSVSISLSPPWTGITIVVGVRLHYPFMFVVTDAAAIRAVFKQDCELSAAIELPRRFPGAGQRAKAWQFKAPLSDLSPLSAVALAQADALSIASLAAARRSQRGRCLHALRLFAGSTGSHVRLAPFRGNTRPFIAKRLLSSGSAVSVTPSPFLTDCSLFDSR
jgi:hypothetical protein